MKLKSRHTVLKIIKDAGYSIEDSHIMRRWPNLLCVALNINKSKTNGFGKAHQALQNCPIEELIEVGLSWSDSSINKKFPPSKMLTLEDALHGKSGNFLFGCVSCTYDVGPTKEKSIHHVDYGKCRA